MRHISTDVFDMKKAFIARVTVTALIRTICDDG